MFSINNINNIITRTVQYLNTPIENLRGTGPGPIIPVQQPPALPPILPVVLRPRPNSRQRLSQGFGSPLCNLTLDAIAKGAGVAGIVFGLRASGVAVNYPWFAIAALPTAVTLLITSGLIKNFYFRAKKERLHHHMAHMREEGSSLRNRASTDAYFLSMVMHRSRGVTSAELSLRVISTFIDLVFSGLGMMGAGFVNFLLPRELLNLNDPSLITAQFVVAGFAAAIGATNSVVNSNREWRQSDKIRRRRDEMVDDICERVNFSGWDRRSLAYHIFTMWADKRREELAIDAAFGPRVDQDAPEHHCHFLC